MIISDLGKVCKICAFDTEDNSKCLIKCKANQHFNES